MAEVTTVGVDLSKEVIVVCAADAKRGDSYLRGLLTQGARSALQSALKRKPEKRSRLEQWIVALHGRVGYHKTLVTIANKYLRILWAMLTKGEDFDATAWARHGQKA